MKPAYTITLKVESEAGTTEVKLYGVARERIASEGYPKIVRAAVELHEQFVAGPPTDVRDWIKGGRQTGEEEAPRSDA